MFRFTNCINFLYHCWLKGIKTESIFFKFLKNQTVNFFDVLLTLLKHKVTILLIVISLTLIALIISLVWPQKFKSSSEIVQVQDTGAPLTGGILQSLTSFSISGSKVGGETILVVLNSQSLREKVIQEFNLFEVYSSNILEEVLRTLNNNFAIEEVREGGFGFNPVVSVKINITDREPERARNMNQFILNELDLALQGLNKDATLETLEVLESRYELNQEELHNAEIELNHFQNQYGIIDVPTQIEALVENLANVKATIIEREVELAVMARNVSQDSPLYRANLIQLEELRSVFRSLTMRSENLAEIDDSFFSLLDYPDLLLDYVRLQREVEIQQMVQETLFPQLEQKRLMRQNSGSGIRVVDSPNIPTYKDSPKRAFIVLAGFFFSIFISVIVVFFRELSKDPDSESARKIKEIKEQLSFKRG